MEQQFLCKLTKQLRKLTSKVLHMIGSIEPIFTFCVKPRLKRVHSIRIKHSSLFDTKSL
jgi:hypothetical protein